MEELLEHNIQWELVLETQQGEIYLIEHGGRRSLLIIALVSYIPIHEFKLLFSSAGEIIRARGIKKLIFDKRKLSVFHQPSMEWYFVHWKEEMIQYGLVTHIKLLPSDLAFQTSVRLGRNKIEAAYPNARFHELTIDYAKTLLEAVNYGL